MKILGSRKPVQPQVGWFHQTQSYELKITRAKEWLEGRKKVKAYQRITKKKEV
jgi:hypothetical protein